MTLWLLKRIDEADYEEAHGYVVRAEVEQVARRLCSEFRHQMVSKKCRDTGCVKGCRGDTRWLDPGVTSCQRLSHTGPSEIILEDFLHG